MNNLYMTNSDFFTVNTNLAAPSNGFNGRVILDNSQTQPFELYNGASKPHHLGNRLTHRLDRTLLSDAFFSKDNIESVHNLIRNTVYEETQKDNDPILIGYKPILIARQNDTELSIIMRSIYLQYGKNLNSNIDGQVAYLNKLVIRETVPGIISALKQKIKYLYDIEHLPIPLAHPQNISSKGEKYGVISDTIMGEGTENFNLF